MTFEIATLYTNRLFLASAAYCQYDNSFQLDNGRYLYRFLCWFSRSGDSRSFFYYKYIDVTFRSDFANKSMCYSSILSVKTISMPNTTRRLASNVFWQLLTIIYHLSDENTRGLGQYWISKGGPQIGQWWLADMAWCHCDAIARDYSEPCCTYIYSWIGRPLF